jgi:hypothetical protein
VEPSWTFTDDHRVEGLSSTVTDTAHRTIVMPIGKPVFNTLFDTRHIHLTVTVPRRPALRTVPNRWPKKLDNACEKSDGE